MYASLTVDTPLTHLFLLGLLLAVILLLGFLCDSTQLSKLLMLERNGMHVCTSHTSSRVGHRCPALRAGDGGLKDVCMAPQLSQCHRLLCKIYHFENCIDNHLPQALRGKAILWFYKAQWGIYRGDVIGMDPKGEVGLLL